MLYQHHLHQYQQKHHRYLYPPHRHRHPHPPHQTIISLKSDKILQKKLVRKLFEKTKTNADAHNKLKSMMKEMQRDRANGTIRNVPRELIIRAETIVGKELLKVALDAAEQEVHIQP
jgi:hypothetical protein